MAHRAAPRTPAGALDRGLVSGSLGVMLGLDPPALALELVQQLTDPPRPRLRICQLRVQLIAAPLAVELILGRIDGGRLLKDPPCLSPQPLIAAISARATRPRPAWSNRPPPSPPAPSPPARTSPTH